MLETLKEPEPLTMEQRSGLDNQQERRESAIRLGAFFEGEGTFIVSVLERKNWVSCTPNIRLGNCDPDAIDEMSRILKLHDVGHYIYLQKNFNLDKHAQVAVINISGYKRVIKFLDCFGDFFFGRKRANVKLFRKYLPLLLDRPGSRAPMELHLERRKLYYQFRDANKQLNRLGVSRFLIDYTPDALKSEDIVKQAAKAA